jgi:glycosyltransferase involved in cell wall biosynthesis
MDARRADSFVFANPTLTEPGPIVAFRGPRSPRRVALVGNYPPRRCGIATFSGDLVEQLGQFRPEIDIDVYALADRGEAVVTEGVTATIVRDEPEAYAAAAHAIEESEVDAVWLQHEYGIFGGPDGEMVCDFVNRLAAPLIVTCHTVLTDPSQRQREILEHLVTRASRIMVMSRRSRDVLVRTYGAPLEIVEVIEHGAPDRPFGREEEFKARRGLSGRTVLMTFGLLGPGKGLERVIEALPEIRARHPRILYRIVGATHPNLVAKDGESYREGLKALADELGVADVIEWEGAFLETHELLDQLEACDIYLTPYPGLQQSTSGTLSYAVALGKAVVSTRYVHACELLADGVGCLIEPASADAIAHAVIDLLDHPHKMAAMKARAYAKGRETIWPRFAAAAAALVEHAAAAPARDAPLARPSLAAVEMMSDATGILQHAIGVIPDRRHGYCLDDNARALMLMAKAKGADSTFRQRWSTVYAAFVQHAWNPDVAKFRNFMRFDRQWCEDFGSDDSNGRAIWALGCTAEATSEPDLRQWAMQLYDQALGSIGELTSPRTVAFTMLGAAAMLRVRPDHALSRDCLERGADLLEGLLGGARRPDWAWFEALLGYDNPRMPQALIEAGALLGRREWLEAGLETLEWICGQQTAASGHFRPIGSETFGRFYSRLPFDQQPLEAQAAIDAAASAWQATGDPRWAQHAEIAWQWFFGANDRGVVLADLATGRCRDGVNPRGVNLNCGAESILAFQLAHCSMLALGPVIADDSGIRLEQDRQESRRPLAHT